MVQVAESPLSEQIDGDELPTIRVVSRTDFKDLVDLLVGSGVGRQLTGDQVARVLEGARILRYASGDFVYRDGDPADTMAIIMDGAVEVLKPGDDGALHALAVLRRGRSLGEAALSGRPVRTADVRALEPTTLLSLTVRGPHASEWTPMVALQLVGELTGRVHRAGARAVQAMSAQLTEQRRRAEGGRALAIFMAFLSLYAMSVRVLAELRVGPVQSTVVTSAGLVLVVLGIAWLVRTSSYPASFFGVIINDGWRRELKEAVLVAAAMCGAATVAAWLAGAFGLVGSAPLFVPNAVAHLREHPAELAAIGLYVAFCPVQELVARGALQGALNDLLTGQKYAEAQTILLSNMIFAATHSHISLGMAVASFIAGVVWGVLYARQRSLFGVSVCHAIVGVYAFEVLQLLRTVNGD